MTSYKEVQNAIKILQNYCDEQSCSECKIRDLCHSFFEECPLYWTDEESEE